MNKYQDIESQDTFHEFKNEKFTQNLRIDFIRKVYGILIFQLLITVILCVFAMYNKSYYLFMVSNAGIALMICAAVLTIVIIIMLFCCIQNARKVPINYILLSIFTICEGYMVSYCCASTSPQIVLMAAIMTLSIVVALTIYAMITKEDFTYFWGILFIFGMIMLVSGIFLIFTSNPILHIIYSAVGVCFYGIYLIYDTQLIMGNKKHSLSVDDYILGAILIYLDIIMIFLYLIKLLDALRNISS